MTGCAESQPHLVPPHEAWALSTGLLQSPGVSGQAPAGHTAPAGSTPTHAPQVPLLAGPQRGLWQDPCSPTSLLKALLQERAPHCFRPTSGTLQCADSHTRLLPCSLSPQGPHLCIKGAGISVKKCPAFDLPVLQTWKAVAVPASTGEKAPESKQHPHTCSLALKSSLLFIYRQHTSVACRIKCQPLLHFTLWHFPQHSLKSCLKNLTMM